MKVLSSSICLVILFALTTFAKTASGSPEMSIELNKYVAAAGEDVYYSAFFGNGHEEALDIGLSTYLYFDLVNMQGERVLNWVIPVRGGKAVGSFTVPDTLSRGYYSLFVFTRTMLYQHNTAFEKLIFIEAIHPDSPNLVSVPTWVEDKEIILNKPEGENYGIQLKADTTNLSKRSELIVNFVNTAVNSSNVLVSISVEEITYTPFDRLPSLERMITLPNERDSEVYRINPECIADETTKRFILGRLMWGTENRAAKNTDVLIAAYDTVVHYLTAQTNDEGVFAFALDSIDDNKTFVIQADTVFLDDYSWEFQNPGVAGNIKIETKTYELTQEQLEYLDRLRNAEIIRKIYARDTSTIAEFTQVARNNFFMPDYSVLPKEYLALPDFKEINDNLLPSVRFKTRKENFRLGVFIYDLQKLEYGSTGLFLNGVPFSNLEFLASLNSEDIKRIDVNNHLVMHGLKTYHGIVSVFTYENETQPSAYNKPLTFFLNSVSEQQKSIQKISYNFPDINNCLLWIPELRISQDENREIVIPTGNISGSYRARVSGVGPSGQVVEEHLFFNVND